MDTNKYMRGKIYKIIDNTNGNIYIGSTCENLLCRRLQKHKASYKCWLNPIVTQGYMRSFEIIKNDDYRIILIEEYPCDTKEQLHAREQYYIDNTVCVNKNNTYFNKTEYQRKWRNKNRENVRKIANDWSKKNPDKRREYNKKYRYSVSVGYINTIDPFLFT